MNDSLTQPGPRPDNAPLVLICDDDQELAQLLQEYLGRNGLRTEWVASAESAVARLCSEQALPDAMVLDIMLPGIDGLNALKFIRDRFTLPVLMLSARGEPIDRIVGLEMGADDYLGKPCLPRELLARLQALLRRSRLAPTPSDEIQLGNLRIIRQERRAWLDGQALDLTSAEFAVLQQLASHAGQIISRAHLTEQCLHRPLERFDRAIDVHVSRLRQKLQALSPRAPDIEGVRGAGYVMRLKLT